ncbi:MAG: hypothetical protein K9G43_12135 [Rhodobacteraceae bacterium]|nr:hypothetical protein [Paracoccaceae bacterium]
MNRRFMPKTLALGAALMASLLSSPPVQIASLGAAALALTAGQAMAQNNIPGVGVIIKKNPGSGAIMEDKSDDKGMLEFSGLEPGEYSVCFADDEGKGDSCADVKVDKEGVIRGQTVFDEKRKAANPEYTGHVTLLR